VGEDSFTVTLLRLPNTAASCVISNHVRSQSALVEQALQLIALACGFSNNSERLA